MSTKSKGEGTGNSEESPHLREVSFLGLRLHLATRNELLHLVAHQMEKRRQVILANHNLHSLYLFLRQPALRDFYSRAEFCHIDGMPLVLLARLFGFPAKRNHRVTYVDLMHPLMARAAHQSWRIFYLGSARGVAEQGAAVLRAAYPGLQIRTMHGYFSTEKESGENQRVLESIREYSPHILMVGMGMPRQELWIHQNRASLSASVILPCGAAMDYVAGAVPLPPRWAGRIGLEWAFRLFNEPRRLWQRYLVEPWFLVRVILHELLKSKLPIGKAPLSRH
jgi:N-acetylglucosaminyldiphosphoundecaprenol N-acetyl-beta-D-mannosaminyltransferase